MKIRTDFVTNSSSSSFICVGIVDDNEELHNYLKEEYGNFGERIFNEYVVSGKDLLDDEYYDYDEFIDYVEGSDDIEIDPDEKYLQARFYVYSDDGSRDGDDAFLWNILERYKNGSCFDKIYEGNAD